MSIDLPDNLIRNQTVIDEHIDAILNDENPRYKVGNQILYDMVKTYPHHDNIDEVVAKAWIINKSYSAQLERYIGKEDDSKDYYYDGIAKVMHDARNEFDRRIEKLKGMKINRTSIEEMFSLHHYLMNLFNKLPKAREMGGSARSFSSKYLHFHLPDMFYIYDSTAGYFISRFVKKPDVAVIMGSNKFDGDLVYVDYGLRLLALQEHIGRGITPRQLDNFLREAYFNRNEWFKKSTK